MTRLRMFAVFFLPAIFGGGLLLMSNTSATAAEGSGAITGRVLWCAPLPVMFGESGAVGGGTGVAPPGVEVVPDAGDLAPGAPAEAAPAIFPVRPYPVPRPPALIPAGAALVAVQGTGLSTRTAEDGRFEISGVPAGQYLTVAAGPISTLNGAFALRPNVLVNAGQTVDVGRLTLAQPCPYYGVPYAVPATGVEAN